MSKEIIYNLEYRENGKKKSIDFKIDFMSNRCRMRYENILSFASDVQIKVDRINFLVAENIDLELNKSDGYKEKIKDNSEKIITLSNLIDRNKAEEIIRERYEIVKQILIDNGIEDEKFLTFKFWDECIEPVQIIDFLSMCYHKDISKKKVNQ